MKPIIRPYIISSTSTYVTKTFSISLTDEETIFNESCYFKTEFSAFPKFENNDYYIEAELMYLDFNTFATMKVFLAFSWVIQPPFSRILMKKD